MKKFKTKQVIVNAMVNEFNGSIYLGDDLVEVESGKVLIQLLDNSGQILICNQDTFQKIFEEYVEEKDEIVAKGDIETTVHDIADPKKKYSPKGRKINYPKTKNKVGAHKKWLPVLVDILKGHNRSENGRTEYLEMATSDLLKLGSKRFGRPIYYSSFHKYRKNESRIKSTMRGYVVYDPPERHQLQFSSRQSIKNEGPLAFVFEEGSDEKNSGKKRG